MIDQSNGYEAEAAGFLASRSTTIGAATVRTWAQSLPPAARVLELGCGGGMPITRTLMEAGLTIQAVDAAPTMVAAFRQQFPDIPVLCAAAEDLQGFDEHFDAALAWGLLFLLTPTEQAQVIARVGTALKRGGRFLFTAPREAVSWVDIRTHQESVSLGYSGYQQLLGASGLVLRAETEDEGSNHYFDAEKN